MPVGKALIDSQYGTNAASVDAGNTPVVGMKDIQAGKVLTSNLVRANLSDKERAKYLLEKGDILINRTNSFDLVGKVGIYDSDIEAAFASYLVRLKADLSQVMPEYLNYWLNGHVAQTTIKRIATKAISQANVNPTEFKKHCYIPLPSIGEQREAVSVLKTNDRVIEKIERLIAAKQKRFKSLIQQLINKNCELWPHFKARDLFRNISIKGYGNEKLLSVTQDCGVLPRTMLEGRVMSPEGSTDNYKLVVPGNFVISLRSFQGGLEYSKYKGIVSPAYTILFPKKEIHDDFYRHFFKSYIFIEKYLVIAVVGIRDGKQISSSDFESVKIPYPPVQEQRYIAEILNTATEEIKKFKQLAKKYRTQKRGLMQKLLTGKWQVNAAKEVA
ncbi:restriction endonuclease [Nitrosococcus oceani]|nr:restriction endonuclease [Nitrosococcus oceani]